MNIWTIRAYFQRTICISEKSLLESLNLWEKFVLAWSLRANSTSIGKPLRSDESTKLSLGNFLGNFFGINITIYRRDYCLDNITIILCKLWKRWSLNSNVNQCQKKRQSDHNVNLINRYYYYTKYGCTSYLVDVGGIPKFHSTLEYAKEYANLTCPILFADSDFDQSRYVTIE